MGSSYFRLGAGISINGMVVCFLVYTLLGDGGDVYLSLSRTYLALSIVAPMAIALLLAMPWPSQSRGVSYALLAIFAALVVGAVALAPEEVAPAQGLLARY